MNNTNTGVAMSLEKKFNSLMEELTEGAYDALDQERIVESAKALYSDMVKTADAADKESVMIDALFEAMGEQDQGEAHVYDARGFDNPGEFVRQASVDYEKYLDVLDDEELDAFLEEEYEDEEDNGTLYGIDDANLEDRHPGDVFLPYGKGKKHRTDSLQR